MSDDATSPAAVGRQLAQRRDDMDLTQDQLAERIGVRARTISAIERGTNAIQRGNRPAWEKALGLKAGTISRAYNEGAAIEVAGRGEQEPTSAEESDAEGDAVDAMLDRIERDPRLQRRLRRILAAGSGHAEDSSGYGTSDTKGDSGRDVAG